MKVLIEADEHFAPFKIVLDHVKPSDEVSDHYENCVYFLMASNIVHVEKQGSISDKWKNSFAITQSYDHNGSPVHLIVFNDHECNRLGLSDREKASVILHEIGHILNRHPKLDSILTMAQCLDQAVNYEEEKLKKSKYLNEDEHYADQFPVGYGFKTELISCLQKSLKSEDYAKLHSQLRQRIQFINTTNDNLEGGVIKSFRYV